MSYPQYLYVLADNWLIEEYVSINDYEEALNMFNNDDEYKELYSTCLQWFSDYVPNMVMDGI